MQKREITAMVATAMLVMFGGCANEPQLKQSQASVAPAVTQNKPAPVAPVAPAGIKLKDLKSKGVAMGVTLKGNPTYSENEPVRFIVDTGSNEGYLYIVYLDNKGETGLLYPNAKSPLSEMGGKYIFPDDFGNMNIRATKDCKECKKEKTSVYALLSKDPILDIKNITKDELLSFVGEKEKGSQSKGLSMDLGEGGTSAEVAVGKLEFVVE